MMRFPERRFIPASIEMRGKPGEGATLFGYVAVFDQPSEVLWELNRGSFEEIIHVGAFKKTIQEADIRATKNHDPNLLLGRTRKLNNVRLWEDGTGLYHELDVPDTATAREVYREVELGLIDQMSFAFEKIRDDWEYERRDVPLRHLRELRLSDIAYVTYPAYPQTKAEARSALSSLAEVSGATVDELVDAIEAGQFARIWTPAPIGESREETTPEPEVAPIEDHALPPSEPDDLLYL
jgi:uncharacterized protein